MSTDPFAAAQVGATATAPADPFTAPVDMDDPFATSSDYRTGDFTPSAPLESLKGRLVVMVPRSLDPNAADPNNPGKTREQYTVDLYVLNGGRLSFWYKVKADAERGTPEEMKEYVVDNVSPTEPFVVLNYWVPQGAIIGKLKKAHANGRPFLGTVAMIPVKADRDKGKTAAQVEAEVAAWIERNRVGARPRYTWVLNDPTPEERAAAIGWWGANRDNIPAITPA